ncbi:hypothetical protein M0805_001989, partial [Coniferiporia weirii]
GKEVVQVYITDLVSSVVTPNQFLAGFQKVEIAPHSSTEVKITIKSSQLAVWTLNNEFVVEPGQFAIKIGSSDTVYANATLTVK